MKVRGKRKFNFKDLEPTGQSLSNAILETISTVILTDIRKWIFLNASSYSFWSLEPLVIRQLNGDHLYNSTLKKTLS